MKPKKLIMSAFCPYAQEVEIDFERFEENGLFLIAGDTGAGKTTIFDAISFALFGEVSGENRGSDSLRSHFAKAETETFVHFEFENKGLSYGIKRNPSYQRPPKRGDSEKLVTETAKAELLLPGTNVVSGSREVTDRVIDILGVNHQQFKQIAMIAQGEFLKLLFADSKERGSIFRKVFATGFYERIQDELKREMKVCYNRLKDIDQAILLDYENIICDPLDREYDQLLGLRESVYTISKMICFLEELVNKRTVEKKEQVKKVRILQESLNKLVGKITSGEELNALILKLEDHQNKWRLLKEQEAEIAAIDKKCRLAKKALYQVKPKMDQWERLLGDEKNLTQEINQNCQLVKEKQVLRDRGQESLKKLTGEEKKRQALAFEIQKIEDSLVDYEKLDQKMKTQKQYQVEEKKTADKKVKLEQEIAQDSKRSDQIKERLIVLKDIETKDLKYQQEKKDLEKERSQLLTLDHLASDILALDKKQANAAVDYQEKEDIFKNRKNDYDQGEMLFYREQAGILAENLSDHSPCPVCGALDHPKKAVKSIDAPSQESLNEEKKKLEEARESFQRSSQRCNRLRIEGENKEEQLKKQALESGLEIPGKIQLFKEAIKTCLEKNDLRVKEVEKALKKIEKEKNEKEELEIEQNTLKEKEKVDKYKLEELRQALSGYGIKLSALEAEVRGLRGMLKYENKEMASAELDNKALLLKRMLAALEEALRADENLKKQISAGETLIEADQKRLDQLIGSLKKAKDDATERLKMHGFETADQYVSALLTEKQIVELEEDIKAHEDDKIRAQVAISEFKDQVGNRKKVDIADLNRQKEQNDQEQAQIYAKLEAIEHVAKTNQSVRDNLARREKERQQFDRDLSAISNLSKTANGELKGKEKLAFEQYVQGVYLDMVLVEANKRFRKMTGNRYYLLRKEDELDKKSKSGLEIDVKDEWTTKSRSVKSLSGGESFKASMALALGLADVIQSFSGGVELNTVFIDEGFGSLDGESLEKAMEILADLTEGNRLVGIISHLDELKGKIDQKIIIKRDPQGSQIHLEVGI